MSDLVIASTTAAATETKKSSDDFNGDGPLYKPKAILFIIQNITFTTTNPFVVVVFQYHNIMMRWNVILDAIFSSLMSSFQRFHKERIRQILGNPFPNLLCMRIIISMPLCHCLQTLAETPMFLGSKNSETKDNV